MINTVRGRLTLWYVNALALILVAFGVAVYVMLSRALHRRVDEALRSTLEISITSLTHDTQEGQSNQSAAQSTAAELSHPQQAMMIFDDAGRLLAEHPYEEDLHIRLPDLGSIPADEVYLYTVTEESDADDHHRLAVRRVRIPPANTPYIILASQPLEAVEDELESLREILYLATPAVLLLAGLGGWFLARQGLAPVADMAKRARQIGAGSLDRQLPVANPRDELGQLATTFNELLARLDAAFDEQRRFMADASHELRTPLSVMSTAAGVTLKKEFRQEGEYREALQMMAEQTRRLSRIVQDMFILARADAGHYPLQNRALYLNDLLDEVARAGSLLASDKNVTVELTNLPEAAFHGDEDLLRQMVMNLVDNAVKFTPAGGTVGLSLARRGGEYLLSVSDTGPGIPAEAREHVFERFYRADKARSRARDGGAGLGLAIARWIARAHDGDLELADSHGTGATFIVRLPLPPVTDTRSTA
ncbi:MAG TPA: heavy metal sensor histidine kinase [Pyrinomonadaceae bacterium]|nr:heavy metal sensor histidine kinase [Pyrinomonadaceae bacterium]